MKIDMRRLTLVLFAAGLVFGQQAIAGKSIYRWVDENGVAHYGDQPNASAERMRVRDGKAVGPSDEEKQETEEMATLRKEQCAMATSRYEEYNGSVRLIEKDDFGKERELSPEERLSAIAKARKDVEAYCEN